MRVSFVYEAKKICVGSRLLDDPVQRNEMSVLALGGCGVFCRFVHTHMADHPTRRTNCCPPVLVGAPSWELALPAVLPPK